MKPYTVLLARPGHLIGDNYMAHVNAANPSDAQDAAKLEAWTADSEGEDPPEDEDEAFDQQNDYNVLATFEGHVYDVQAY